MILLEDALAQARRECGLTQDEPAARPYNGGDDQEPCTALAQNTGRPADEYASLLGAVLLTLRRWREKA